MLKKGVSISILGLVRGQDKVELDSTTHKTRFVFWGEVGRKKGSGDMRKLLKLVERAKENPLEVRMNKLRGKISIETYADASSVM